MSLSEEVCAVCGTHRVEVYDLGGGATARACPKVRPGSQVYPEPQVAYMNVGDLTDPTMDAVRQMNNDWAKQRERRFAGPGVTVIGTAQHDAKAGEDVEVLLTDEGLRHVLERVEDGES